MLGIQSGGQRLPAIAFRGLELNRPAASPRDYQKSERNPLKLSPGLLREARPR
jgi:hypothetical protein